MRSLSSKEAERLFFVGEEMAILLQHGQYGPAFAEVKERLTDRWAEATKDLWPPDESFEIFYDKS